MSPMKNPILGIENPLVGLLFNRISIFEKKLNHDLKFWIFDFLCYFCKGFCISNMPSCPISIFGLRVLRGRSNDWNELVLP